MDRTKREKQKCTLKYTDKLDMNCLKTLPIRLGKGKIQLYVIKN